MICPKRSGFPLASQPTDRLSVNTLAGDSVSASGVAGVLQVLVDGAPV
jgi:hypothetical protein